MKGLVVVCGCILISMPLWTAIPVAEAVLGAIYLILLARYLND